MLHIAYGGNFHLIHQDKAFNKWDLSLSDWRKYLIDEVHFNEYLRSHGKEDDQSSSRVCTKVILILAALSYISRTQAVIITKQLRCSGYDEKEYLLQALEPAAALAIHILCLKELLTLLKGKGVSVTYQTSVALNILLGLCTQTSLLGASYAER